MDDHGLIYNPKTRKWDEPPAPVCPLGHPPTHIQLGWKSCKCGGHRTIRCERNDPRHDEVNRYRLRPEPGPVCSEETRLMAPDGELTSGKSWTDPGESP